MESNEQFPEMFLGVTNNLSFKVVDVDGLGAVGLERILNAANIPSDYTFVALINNCLIFQSSIENSLNTISDVTSSISNLIKGLEEGISG